jgi:hypothetical protein
MLLSMHMDSILALADSVTVIIVVDYPSVSLKPSIAPADSLL